MEIRSNTKQNSRTRADTTKEFGILSKQTKKLLSKGCCAGRGSIKTSQEITVLKRMQCWAHSALERSFVAV